MAAHTTLFLVRCGETDWARTRRLMGRRDVPLSEVGRTQAQQIAALLAPVELAEVLSSPLLRTVETAETIAVNHKIEVARDPRLNNLHVGVWEGRSHEELDADAEYKAFQRAPLTAPIPGGETLLQLRDRLVASVQQALEDNGAGCNIVMVTHSAGVRMVLAHFLSMDLAKWNRLRITPGSLSVMRFASDRDPPRVLAINHGPALAHFLE